MAQNHSALEVEEVDQAGECVATYIASPEDETSRVDIIIPENTTSYAKSLLNAFLPAGYPHSVTPDYIHYQLYDSLQAFASSIAGLLSSRAVLEGIGVGDSHASPTAALLLSVLQDSMGRIATILFAYRLGTSLEPECKMYRLAADIFNDAAMILDCLSPAFPKNARVVLLSFSSVLRALCGVAAGSSKASLSAHFATQGNLGELNAKDSSQETVLSLVGMLAGTLIVSHISSRWATWTALIALLAMHLSTNYLAVRSVSLRTLNRQRANLLFSDFLEKVPKREVRSRDSNALEIGLLTPEEVSSYERVFERDGVLRWKGEVLGYCRLGVSLQTVLSHLSRAHDTTGSYKAGMLELLDTYKDEDHILWYDSDSRTYFIVLKEGSTTVTQLKAWMHALYSAKQGYLLTEKNASVNPLAGTLGDVTNIIKFTDLFRQLEKAGWDINIGAMETRSGTRLKIKQMGTGESKPSRQRKGELR